uniref:Acetylglutamate kinase n=1 Tax=Campylaephora sungminbooi TaxID=1896769 RepID=A0A1B0RRI5_9FLOR|nr:acetylglutamate kinase [Campylaephora sungminbooi]AKU47387.1 acetylglutamate kinase [Campylaephora sungminbooi]ALN11834.1 acetylglutamate kinase [Campylaephora sungminbooi]
MSTFNFNWFLDNCLPFIYKLRNKVIVIKYGGAAMKNNHLKAQVIKDILFLFSLGIKVVLVHGGGPFINDWLNLLNIEPKFENGIRTTDAKTMEVVEMVLVGKINKELVNLININDNIGIGLSGKDSNLLLASNMFNDSNNLVGKIDSVNIKVLTLLLDNGYIPVIASVASSCDLITYNINADTAAGTIAQALNAEKLVLLTDTPGILLDIKEPDSLQKKLDIDSVQDLCEHNIISGGMIPKVQCCLHALKNNVKTTHIIDGRIQHSLLFELLTSDRIGSQIVL